jgi:hypothetical protein
MKRSDHQRRSDLEKEIERGDDPDEIAIILLSHGAGINI